MCDCLFLSIQCEDLIHILLPRKLFYYTFICVYPCAPSLIVFITRRLQIITDTMLFGFFVLSCGCFMDMGLGTAGKNILFTLSFYWEIELTH